MVKPVHSLLYLLSYLIVSYMFCDYAAGQEANRPNIVFVIADDLGINDLGCYGRAEHATPNLDRLAAGGVRFTAAYSAQSVCSPTRAALLTGQTPARLKLTTFLPGRSDAVSQMLLHPRVSPQLPVDVTTLPERLRHAGYISACIGKWHLGNRGCLPTDRGFDVYHPGVMTTTPSKNEGGKGEFDLTGQAEKFMELNKDRPFFLYVAHNSPHIPLAAQAELIAKNQNTFNPTYAAMMETLDLSIGRLIAKLSALNLDQKTMVVFTSDNGGLHVLEGGQTPTHNHPYRAGKGFLYEGGIRIPLIVKWPGKTIPGTVAKQPVISTDWTPTLLAAAGLSTTDAFDGINILDLITSTQTTNMRSLYWHQPHYMNQGSRPAGAIREGPWKLIEHYENGQCELYHLDTDVGETKDRSADEAPRVADLRGKLERWRREVSAQVNEPNPSFNANAWKKLYREVNVSSLTPDALASTTSQKLLSWRTAMNGVLGNQKPTAGPGVIMLVAKDALIQGEKLRYEPEPHKDTLGYWANPSDWAQWTLHVPRAGQFEIELLQAAGKGSGGALVEVSIAGQSLSSIVEETGHFQRFVPRTIGTVRLPKGAATLTIRAKSKPGFGVMDLRRIVLRGVPES